MTNSWRFARRGTFWSAAAVLALCLWASGAPSVLYPVYAAEWHLPAVVTTSVFGAYPLALLIVLLFFGGLSDSIGRRRAMLLGVALIAIAAAVFALAPNVGWLFAGRILQGLGTGFALGAASAALVENNTSPNPRVASTLTTASTATGLTVALILSGFLAQYAPFPLVLSFAVLFVVAALVFVAVGLTPSDTAGLGAPSWKPKAIRMPRGMLLAFIAAVLSVSVAYSVGAIFLSLGAQMARELTGTTDLLVIGALLGVSSIAIGMTALFLRGVPAHVSIVVGGILSLGGLLVMAGAAAWGSLPLFFAWCIVGGIGYSFAFTGGLGLINKAAPVHHRGGTLSLVYLFSYLLQALTAVGAGALATAVGLGVAVDIMAPLLGVLAVAAILCALLDVVRARRSDAPSPALSHSSLETRS